MRKRRLGLTAIGLCVAVTLMSCAPTYDNIADQMLADTQKQADDGLLKLETLGSTIQSLSHSSNPADQKTLADAKKQADYESNIDFYSKLQSSVIALETRMTAMPDSSSQKITNSLNQIEDNVVRTRDVHSTQGTLTPAFVHSTRQILDQQFKTLTVYELTIKNGNKSP